MPIKIVVIENIIVFLTTDVNKKLSSEEVLPMVNLDIRRTAAANGVRLWQIAEAYGMSDSSLSKMLRRELPPEKKQEILVIIDELAPGGD